MTTTEIIKYMKEHPGAKVSHNTFPSYKYIYYTGRRYYGKMSRFDGDVEVYHFEDGVKYEDGWNISVEQHWKDIKPGDIVAFCTRGKRDTTDDMKDLYKVIAVNAFDTDTRARKVIFQSLYNLESAGITKGDIFIMDAKRFFGYVNPDDCSNLKNEFLFTLFMKGEK